MEYVSRGWYPIEGWNDAGVSDAQERHWPTLVRNVQGTGPLGVSHLPWHRSRDDLIDHNIMMSYGYVIAAAARKKDRLSILDWGGGVGHYNLYTKALLPDVACDYECYDLPNLCRIGQKLQPEVRIHDDRRQFAGKEYDVVVSSSALHYFEDWREELRNVAVASREFLYVARLQVVLNAPSFVALHKLRRSGYREFLSWCINRQEFLSHAEACGFTLLREFIHTEPWVVRGAPEQGQCRGYLLCRGGGRQ